MCKSRQKRICVWKRLESLEKVNTETPVKGRRFGRVFVHLHLVDDVFVLSLSLSPSLNLRIPSSSKINRVRWISVGRLSFLIFLSVVHLSSQTSYVFGNLRLQGPSLESHVNKGKLFVRESTCRSPGTMKTKRNWDQICRLPVGSHFGSRQMDKELEIVYRLTTVGSPYL